MRTIESVTLEVEDFAAAQGSGSHRPVIGCDSGHLTDPDGFVWEPARGTDRGDGDEPSITGARP